ncbi:hypothetical protein FB451DRAFT_1377346 [Mycena latifolia]|nr:hypothetical protein FB451DRAFT_1377346 [Mycena latifolia]
MCSLTKRVPSLDIRAWRTPTTATILRIVTQSRRPSGSRRRPARSSRCSSMPGRGRLSGMPSKKRAAALVKWYESGMPVGVHPFRAVRPYRNWAITRATKALDRARMRLARHFHFIREIPMFVHYEVRARVGAWNDKWVSARGRSERAAAVDTASLLCAAWATSPIRAPPASRACAARRSARARLPGGSLMPRARAHTCTHSSAARHCNQIMLTSMLRADLGRLALRRATSNKSKSRSKKGTSEAASHAKSSPKSPSGTPTTAVDAEAGEVTAQALLVLAVAHTEAAGAVLYLKRGDGGCSARDVELEI